MGCSAFASRSANLDRVRWLAVAFALAIGLSGCVEDAAEVPPPATPPSDNIARRPGVNPAGATVEVASVSGAPRGLDDKYQAMLAAFAKQNSVSVISSGATNYLLRAYLSANADDGNATTVAYVLDIFDARKHRTQRISNQVILRGQAADPWSLVSDDILASLAQSSATDLAAVMTNTPEAIAASATPATAAAQTMASTPPAAQDSGQTVVAATPPSAPAPQTAATQPAPNTQGMTAQR